MKTIALSAVLAATATAALASGPVEPAPPPVVHVVPTAYDWSGAYAGVGLAYTRATTSTSAGQTLPDASGPSLGALAGYNWQRNNTVLGVEGALSFSNLSGTNNCGVGANTCTVTVNNFASIRGRVGYAMDRTMYFMTLGYATDARSYSNTVTGTASGARFNGPMIGVGIEHAMNDRWSVRGDLEHYIYGSETIGAETVSARTTLLRIGLMHRF